MISSRLAIARAASSAVRPRASRPCTGPLTSMSSALLESLPLARAVRTGTRVRRSSTTPTPPAPTSPSSGAAVGRGNATVYATVKDGTSTWGAFLRDNRNFALGVGGGLVLAGLHSATGSANDFYDYRFESRQNPDDLASFYGGEELMELFCVFPVIGQIMMRNGRFDEEGNVLTTGFPGTMKVSMVFSDEENSNTGQTDWFNKRERFRNTLFGYTCWDMVINFGFRTLEDGTFECYHFGEYFHGNLPVVSQIMILVFQVHARWVAWSTEHHINHYAFAGNSNSEAAEEAEEESRANMPLFLLRNYAGSDLTAMAFGSTEEKGAIGKRTSFLVRGAEGGAGEGTADDAEMFDDEEVDGEEEEDRAKLPFQQKAIQLQISEDIAADRKVMKSMLARSNTSGNNEDVKTVLARRHTMVVARSRTANEANNAKTLEVGAADEGTNAYALAKDLAVDRALMRRKTRRTTILRERYVTAPAAAPLEGSSSSSLRFETASAADAGAVVADEAEDASFGASLKPNVEEGAAVIVNTGKTMKVDASDDVAKV